MVSDRTRRRQLKKYREEFQHQVAPELARMLRKTRRRRWPEMHPQLQGGSWDTLRWFKYRARYAPQAPSKSNDMREPKDHSPPEWTVRLSARNDGIDNKAAGLVNRPFIDPQDDSEPAVLPYPLSRKSLRSTLDQEGLDCGGVRVASNSV